MIASLSEDAAIKTMTCIDHLKIAGLENSNRFMSDSGYHDMSATTATATNDSVNQRPETIQGMIRFEKPIDKRTSQSFADIVERLKGPLLEELRKTGKQFRPMAIRLLVCGTDKVSARPYIVVFCPDTVCKKMKRFFRKEEAQRLCRPNCAGMISFDVLIEGQPLIPKACWEPMEVTLSQNFEYGNRPWTAHIRIDGIGTSSYATMGGIVVVVDNDGGSTMYGLTAGHTFVQAAVDRESAGLQSDQYSSDEAMSDSEFSDQNATKQQPITLEEEASTLTAMSPRQADTITTANPDLARIAPTSFTQSARNRDWALIEGLEHFYPVARASEQSVNDYFVNDTRFGISRAHKSVEIAYQPHCMGTLSHVPAFTVLPFGEDFVCAYTITPRDGHVIPPGASGSWVLTERAGWLGDHEAHWTSPDDANIVEKNLVRVCGHVVADDALGDVYMIPLVDTLSDIAHELANAREARLPKSTAEIEAALGRLNIRTPKTSTDVANPSGSHQTSDLAEGASLAALSNWKQSADLEYESQANIIQHGMVKGSEDTTRTKSTGKSTEDVDNNIKEHSGDITSTSTEPKATAEHMLTPAHGTNPKSQSSEFKYLKDGSGSVWICCECGNPNSLAIDVGCAMCSAWRCDQCVVEMARF